MTIKEKTLIILALLIIAFSTFCLISFAEEPSNEITVNDINSLNDAIQNSTKTYIKLGADITVDEPITVARDNITIDLNGHTVTAYKSDNTILFNLQLGESKFKITGSGTFNTCRTIIFYTNKIKDTEITISATGTGITVTSPELFNSPYFKVGVSSSYKSSLTINGTLNIYHQHQKDSENDMFSTFDINDSSTINIVDASINDYLHPDVSKDISFNTFNIYKNANVNISNSTIRNECGSVFNIKSGLNTTAPTVSVEKSSLFALNGYLLNSNGTFSNLKLQNSNIEYSHIAFKASGTSNGKFFLNLDMIDTHSKFNGTNSQEASLLNGKITAIIDGGFHNLNGASLAIGTTPYDDTNASGILIKTGTAISCDYSDNANIAIENKNAEIAKWYGKSENFIAMGYYDSAQEAELDISLLPTVIVDDKDYNLRYSYWILNKSEHNTYIFTPDETKMEPTSSLNGIKYNLSTYTNFNMNIYIPEAKDIIGGYWDASCSYPIENANYKIDGTDYMKYSFSFGASDMDSIVMYVKYNVNYQANTYELIQKIEVSVIDYTKAILNDNAFSETEKRLAADTLRYCNETLKLANGSYNSYATDILNEHSEHLTNLNTMEMENTSSDTSLIAYYINEAMLLFDSYEPKFAFRYTENVTSPSIEANEGCIWLNVSYISLDGVQKYAKIEIDTDNKIFYTSEISAYDIDELFTIEIYSSDSPTPIAEGTFSLGTYISTLKSTSIDITFAKALYAYSLSAEEYKSVK